MCSVSVVSSEPIAESITNSSSSTYSWCIIWHNDGILSGPPSAEAPRGENRLSVLDEDNELVWSPEVFVKQYS